MHARTLKLTASLLISFIAGGMTNVMAAPGTIETAESTHFYDIGKNGCVTLPGQRIKGCFDSSGAHFSNTDKVSISMHLVAWGRNEKLHPVGSAKLIVAGNRTTYAWGQLIEWWRTSPIGFEQGFTINRRQAGRGDLQLSIATNIKGQIHNGSLAWGRFRYGHLVVTDAKGKLMPANLIAKGNRVLIQINDDHAHYPLTVDPLIWIEQKIAPNNLVTNDLFGYAVAISDTTALIGAISPTVVSNGKPGTVYVFTESDGSWNLTGNFRAGDGTDGDEFGSVIVLDGTTAFIGAPDAEVSANNTLPHGAVYVFKESGGTWIQTQKITADDGAYDDLFGTSAAVSGDTLVVGAPGATINPDANHQGAAYIFTNNNGTWTQQQKLAASNGAEYDLFGKSLAIDGATALIGSPYTNVNGYPGFGTAYIFTKANGIWSQKAVLEPNDGMTDDNFSLSLALAGNTALIGAPSGPAQSEPGAVYVFTNSGGTWLQSQELNASDSTPDDQFGASLALNGDTFVTSAPHITVKNNFAQGAVYIFSDSSGIWKEEQELFASEGKEFDNIGNAVALSKTAALIGDNEAATSKGVAYVYGESDLDLADDAPAKVIQGNNYTSQVIATNSSSTTSPAISISAAVPAGADFVSVNATKGSCNETSGTVNCDFGAISGNGGIESANITFNAIGSVDAYINNVAAVKKATPALNANAPTKIMSGSTGGGDGGGNGSGNGGGGTTGLPALLALAVLLGLARRQHRSRLERTVLTCESRPSFD